MNSYPDGLVLDANHRWITSKDPDGRGYYGLTVADQFPGRTITSLSIADVQGVSAANPGFSGAVCSVFVTGGEVGQTGTVTLRFELDDGTRDDLTLHFLIEQH